MAVKSQWAERTHWLLVVAVLGQGVSVLTFVDANFLQLFCLKPENVFSIGDEKCHDEPVYSTN